MGDGTAASAAPGSDADAALTAPRTQVIFIGGCSGVGKTTVAAELSRRLAERDISHAIIEGDNLDQAHPQPWRQGIDLAEQNLAAMWSNYRAIGHSRLVYTNTVSVLQTAPLITALGVEVDALSILLTAQDSTASDRLARRELGSGLDDAIARSAAAAELDSAAPVSVRRVSTDHRPVVDIAAEILALSGWAD